MSPVTIRTRKVRLDDQHTPNPERTLILVSSNTGKAQQIKTTHVPAILNHTRHVISQQVPQIRPKTVIVSRAKTPLILADTNKVNTPRATVIYAGSRPIIPKTVVTPQNTSQVTRIVTSASASNKTFPLQTFKVPSTAPKKTFVNIVSSRPTTHISSNSVESRLQQQTSSRPARPGTPAPWSSAAEDDHWSRPCTPRPNSSFRIPRSRWPSVDPSYEAPKLPSPEKPKCSSYPTEGESYAPHVVSTTDDNGNIIKQEIKTELNEENIDSIPISVVLAPLKRPLSDVQNGGAKKKTKISIAQDNKLGPVKEHVNTVFDHYGVTASFSPNMEKLVEITGSTALNYLLYVDWCKKKGIRTVNQETYGRLFRNEFKKLVGTR